ncbi:MAG: GxxExxY protein [Anaerolineales bacterium]
MSNYDETAKVIVDAAIKVHRALGPGLLESAYQQCLTFELTECGRLVECEVTLPIEYSGHHIDAGHRLDMRVGGCVIVENKAVEQVLSIHRALLTYLKLSHIRLGLLLNWNVKLMKDGIERFIL